MKRKNISFCLSLLLRPSLDFYILALKMQRYTRNNKYTQTYSEKNFFHEALQLNNKMLNSKLYHYRYIKLFNR